MSKDTKKSGYQMLDIGIELSEEHRKLIESITKPIYERVLDPNRPVKGFDDVIELGMYGSSQLGNYDDLNFLEGLKKVEIKLEEDSTFKGLQSNIAKMRQQVSVSPELEKVTSSLADSFAKLSNTNQILSINPAFKSLTEGQNELREQAFKLAQPNQEWSDAMQRVSQITEGLKIQWDEKIGYHKEEKLKVQADLFN